MNVFEQIKEKLITKINYSSGYPNCSEYDYAYECAMNDARKQAIEIVEQVEKEHNSGWIPCSDMVPEIEADVLLSLRSLDVYTGFRSNEEGCYYVEGEGYVKDENVIAWQSLPEPYKESEDK